MSIIIINHHYNTHTHTHTHIHTHTHTYTHTHIHTYTHTHTYTHLLLVDDIPLQTHVHRSPHSEKPMAQYISYILWQLIVYYVVIFVVVVVSISEYGDNRQYNDHIHIHSHLCNNIRNDISCSYLAPLIGMLPYNA